MSRPAASAPGVLRGKPLEEGALHDRSARAGQTHRKLRTHSKKFLLPGRCYAHCRPRRPDERSVPWQALDKASIASTGGSRFAGRAHYSAAEFAVPGCRALGMEQGVIGAGTHRPALTSMRRMRYRGAGNAAGAVHEGGLKQMVCLLLLHDSAFPRLLLIVDVDQEKNAAAQVRVRYRREEPVTSMDAVLAQAYPPRNGERPPDSRRGVSTRVRHRGGNRRCDLQIADGTSQSDGAARDFHSLGRKLE